MQPLTINNGMQSCGKLPLFYNITITFLTKFEFCTLIGHCIWHPIFPRKPASNYIPLQYQTLQSVKKHIHQRHNIYHIHTNSEIITFESIEYISIKIGKLISCTDLRLADDNNAKKKLDMISAIT